MALKMALIVLAMTTWSCLTWASDTQSTHVPVVFQFDQKHQAFNRILHRYVQYEGSVGVVDYTGLKKNRKELDAYTIAIESIAASEFQGFSQNEKLSFLLNAYNALTLKLIVDNFPGIQSIKDIKGSFSLRNPTRSPWKISFFKLFMDDHTLDDIEHEMIRKKFNEPRIHFALVCASKGCPGLRNEAYDASRLEQQLDSATNAFLKDSTRNRFDSNEKTLYLSSIFKWYGGDFEKKSGSIKSFVAPRMASTPEEEKQILNKDVKIKYLDYDWSLNGK